jgi:hypothetical protein
MIVSASVIRADGISVLKMIAMETLATADLVAIPGKLQHWLAWKTTDHGDDYMSMNQLFKNG